MAGVIAINELGVDDWTVWRELRLAALADSPAAFRATYEHWSGPADTEQNWRNRLADRPFNAVLVLHGRHAGMVSATDPDADGTVELHSMWVAPFARGRGVSDAAIDAVVEWSTRRAARSVLLYVKAANESAQRLYRRHGFVPDGVSADYPDERAMRRVLAP